MGPHLRIADGFANQVLISLPPDQVAALAALPLSERLFVTIAGDFPEAGHHYRDRPAGCGDTILIYCRAGRGWCRLGQRRMDLTPGQAILIGAGLPHAYGADDPAPWSISWAHLRGSTASVYQEMFGSRPPVTTVPGPLRSRVETLFAELLDSLQQDLSLRGGLHAGAVLGHLLSVIFLAHGGSADRLDTSQADRVQQVVRSMRDRLDQPLTLSELADQAGVSVPHLCRLFRRRMGTAPMDYLLRLRIQRGCQLLAISSARIERIARAVGYRDPFYFSRVFRKVMGQSPSQYRRQHRRNDGPVTSGEAH